ncbi:DNA-binding transcriptional LysR family regulator [Acidovorax delafieldii]|uniref:DNA-binding transcriptional LysR family regulator n=1 Tax=Acidovorax delafieldii TaxID=47920 RepID=A0A561XTL5_ACIDE|nr:MULTISPECIES: LysR family transcriptional regulator [Acidovorax]KQW32743.1 LysR family transcriptional regulator [Acidovorax sp. Root402]TWG39452.1 DNA-binding transcriptional LysR family regulator [Acidovorax delafieldii]
MNLRHLEHFLALSDMGSFSRAAEKLHITQSALSRSIQSLEEELGGPLLDRIGKRNELTPLGQSVLERARGIVKEAAELKRGAALLQQGGLGSLRLGLGSGPGALLMTPWLVYMATHHPGVKVSVTRGPTEVQLRQLRDRSLDALVVDIRRIVPAADLSIGPTFDMPAGMVCRAGHPLLAQYPNGVPFEALLSYPVASIPLSEEIARILVARYGPRADPAEMTTLQCEEISSLLQTVQQSDAIYLGILAAARQEMSRGDLVQLSVVPHLDQGAVLGVVTLAGRTEQPVMRVFRDFVVRMLNPSDDTHRDVS